MNACVRCSHQAHIGMCSTLMQTTAGAVGCACVGYVSPETGDAPIAPSKDTIATFSDKARSEAKYLLKTHAPGKVGTPEGEQEIKAFLAGTRFAENHYADEIERLAAKNAALRAQGRALIRMVREGSAETFVGGMPQIEAAFAEETA